MAEIPFWVHDRPKWVSGITKSTTCQDVLHSLVLAERRANKSDKAATTRKKEAREEETAAKEVSRGLALVEQWRGVERPLSNSSRILKLWLAWGEERSQVRFVVKRISSATMTTSTASSSAAQKSGSVPSLVSTRSRSRPRRRNSRASVTSDTKRADTLHPNVLKGSSSSELERLMRIILTQGETIHWQLKKLQEREGQIDTIEQEVHDTRTKTAGKDYLLNAYLSQDSKKSPVKDGGASSLEATAEGLHDILDALGKVFKLNEQLQEAEEKMQDLQTQLTVHNQQQQLPEPCEGKLQNELKDLRTCNEQAGREIDYNRHLISSMRLAYDERKALMDKLEQDVDNIELEGQRLQKELQALTASKKSRQEQTFDILSQVPTHPNDDIEDSDEEEPIIFGGGFLDADNNKLGHYNILTSEQLYEGPSQEPGALYDELQRRLRIKTTLDLRLQSPDDHSTNRIKATGSPGSNSSSGNSSGSGASYEKSVRFNDRELILSTPELPVVVTGPSKKSILKPGEVTTGSTNGPGDNTDSNSDTGLSSLHSSSDEGTYVLDTLV